MIFSLQPELSTVILKNMTTSVKLDTSGRYLLSVANLEKLCSRNNPFPVVCSEKFCVFRFAEPAPGRPLRKAYAVATVAEIPHVGVELALEVYRFGKEPESIFAMDGGRAAGKALAEIVEKLK